MTWRRVATAARFACVSTVLLAVVACAQSEDGASRITASVLAERVEARNAPIILDVRSEAEYAGGHIPGALNIPYDQLEERIAEIPGARFDEIVVHCKSGRRAGLAEVTLREAGFTEVRDLDGHWMAWSEAGLPSE